MSQRIVGAFNTEQEATKAIEDLKQQGFTTEDISVIAKDRDEATSISDETGTKAPEGLASGAATGGVLGGVTGLLAGIGALAIPGIGPIVAAGPIAATLTGAAVGAGAGGLVGGLIGLGIPEEEAEEYDEYVEEGRILVLVDVDGDRTDAVYDVFRQNNTLNGHRYNSTNLTNSTNNNFTGNAGASFNPNAETAVTAEETVAPNPNLYQGHGAGTGGAADTKGAVNTGANDVPPHYTENNTNIDLDNTSSGDNNMINTTPEDLYRKKTLREETDRNNDLNNPLNSEKF